MQCPFLKEAQVESCRHSMVRKLIVRNPENLARERCLSGTYGECPLYASTPDPYAADLRCPFLEDSLVQYCAADAVPKLIPFSEAVLSRCGTEAFRYCDLFINMAHPQDSGIPEVDGVAIPQWLHYAPNHMWLDQSAGGVFHIGVDALLARVLGAVDRITFLTTCGVHHPAVVLSSGETDFHMAFPNRLLIHNANVYLRANPAKLCTDPYRAGWLFECRTAPEEPDPSVGLRRGADAVEWMHGEFRRVSDFVHQQVARAMKTDDAALACDGGTFAPGVVRQLDRGQAAQLYHDRFSPASMR